MYMTEALTGGLVQLVDPAFIPPGSLQRADNCMYLPNDIGLYRALGTTILAASSSNANIRTISPIRFSGGQQYVIAQFSDASSAATDEGLYYFDPNLTAPVSFNSLFVPYDTSRHMRAIHFSNKWYLLNGENDNLVLDSDLNTYPHGMQPVQTPAALSIVSKPFSLSTSGSYEYWYTEVRAYPDGSEDESAYTATIVPNISVAASLSTHAPKLTFPGAPTNADATHYRIYRSASLHPAGGEDVFPLGYKVGEILVTETSWEDVATSAATSGWSTSADAPATKQSAWWTTYGSITGATDAAFAVYQHTGSMPSGSATGSLMVRGFGLASSGNIAGIVVDCVAKSTDPANTRISASIGTRRAANDATFSNISKTFSGLSTVAASLSVGSSVDSWRQNGESWNSDEVNSSAFAVTISVRTTSNTTVVSIDSVKVTVYYGSGGGSTFGKVYDYIEVEVDGESVLSAANLPPPKASTGCVFQNSMVLNDVENPRRVVWSLGGTGGQFPSDVYYIENLGGQLSDEILLIEKVNDRCLVFMSSSSWRISYLPKETDAAFSPNDAISPLSTTLGISNPDAYCLYSPDGVSEQMAFVNGSGLHSTDGLTVTCLSDALDWASVIGADSDASGVVGVVNDPDTKTIRVNFVSFEYIYHYGSMHQGKWTGPNRRRWNNSAVVATANTKLDTGVYTNLYAITSTSATVTREDGRDTGYVNPIAASSYNEMVVETRDIYPGAMNGEVEVNDVMWYGKNLTGDTDSVDATVVLSKKFLRSASADETLEASTSESDGKLLSASVTEGRCGGFSVRLTPTTNDFVKLYAVLPNVESFGDSENA